MTISNDVTELENINKEIKRLNEILKPLRKRKQELEESILKYMEEQDQPGLKYKDMIITSEVGVGREKKKKEEKVENLKQVLQKMGAHANDDAVDKVMNAIKGKPVDKLKLKLINKNDEKKKKSKKQSK